MTPTSLISAAEDVLRQGCGLIDAVDTDTYAGLEEESSSSIGAHYRHILDHFQCLLDGVRARSINYDARRRSPIIETSRAAATVATEHLIDEFRRLPAHLFDQPCSVVYNVSYNGEAVAVPSTVAREIMFCVGHAIHHYAILKMLCTVRSVALPYEFGVAPSTLRHLETAAAH
jgi:DinB family protein